MSSPHRKGPTQEAFMDKYAQYFGIDRVKATQDMGFYFIEDGGEGAYVWDTEGRKVLDFWGVGGVNNLGHRNPVVMAEFEKAMKEEDFGSLFWFSEAKGELVKKLAETTPERLKITLPCVTGSEAVDEAIKLARGATGRVETLYCSNAYHGHTGISLSMMTADDCRAWCEPLVPGFRQFDYDDVSSLAKLISNRTAAVIVEVVQTDFSGLPSKDANFWSEVRRLCDENGAKLIIDEVVTGMGRLGEVWGCNLWDIDPDMICVGKGFSGGVFPMAAVICAEDVLDFWGVNPYRSMSSYAWSNVGCRTTKVAIEETERLLPSAMKAGDKLEQAILDIQEQYPDHITNLNRTGMLFSIELNEQNFTSLEAFGGMWQRDVAVVASSQHAPIFKLYPPMILNDDHVAEFANKFEDCTRNAQGGGHQGWFD
ncbi:MAG: aspartate aminotransferase family protein [Amphritea sp.]